jgi:hypothetical protein
MEAIRVLYSENTFRFRQTRTIVELKATILSHRLLAIRSLHLDCPLETYWDEHWNCLHSMKYRWPYDVPFFLGGGVESHRRHDEPSESTSVAQSKQPTLVYSRLKVFDSHFPVNGISKGAAVQSRCRRSMK